MQFIQVILLCFAAISSVQSIIPIRRFHSSRRRNPTFEMELNERHYHMLLQIANKDAISILDTDFMNYSPPYLKEFCVELDSLIEFEYGDSQSDITLDKIATRFKETVYTEVNFPHTYRPDTQVRVDNAELLQYRRAHCYYQTKEEIWQSRILATYFPIMIIFIFVLFCKM